jgi:hypothetical protein
LTGTVTAPRTRAPFLQSWTLVFGLGLLGCTAISNFDVTQCRVDADCDTLDGPIRQCVESRCAPGCSSNRHCASLDPRFAICPRVGEACAPLLVEGGACYQASNYDDEEMGPLTGEDLLTIGVFAPSIQSSTWLTVQLAVAELNARGGLPTASGLKRPVLAVTCNDAPSAMADAIAHLARLPVRALLASVDQRSLDIALSLNAGPDPLFLLAPRGSDRLTAESVIDPLWSLGAPSSAVLAAYPTLIEQVVQSAVARGANLDLLRFASLVSAAPEDRALADAVTARIGGANRIQLMGEDRFRPFDLTDDADSERQRQLQELADYAPDLVLVFAGGFFADADRRPRTSVLRALEQLAAETPGWSPLYVLGPRNAEDAVLRGLALEDGSFRSRNVGMTADRAAYPEMRGPLAARFNAAFPEAGSELFVEPSTYDALYYLAYALASSSSKGVATAASDVLAGLRQITTAGAERIDVGLGATGVERATLLLAARTPFDLFGTSGPAEFDASHSRSDTARAYCWPGAGELETLTAYDGAHAAFDTALACGGKALGDGLP